MLQGEFAKLDIDGNGAVVAKELKEALEKMGGPIEPGQVEKMMKEADIDGEKFRENTILLFEWDNAYDEFEEQILI